MTNRKLVVVTYDNSVTKDGKTRYLDVQLDARDPLAKGQTNLHATTTYDKEKDRYNNGAPYSVGQYEDMVKAAGDNITKLPNGATVMTLDASLMVQTRGNKGLIINTKKDMAPGLAVDEKIMDNQFAAIQEAKAAKAAEAQVEAPEAEVEAEAEAPQVDEPEV